ncbi:pyridoxamine 5'-phosphate oxidase family protein [Ornithinimicrobium sp. F0845]|uniref:pyridoxamine 5'-phosphate oxidase family protein n=1 Tax=Ornithinimicrobium sp. F0845 TaxID=2926412 RepID=UPI001FF2B508|nr:pyridoxamine 5'-phosphate oxidase family protein [Ornithinimicrobium sp. F0845]MCK0112169.1 pyridoxamine 5'-phosphate oxidase family protein [Ornithinimicrobium sp. F0845]
MTDDTWMDEATCWEFLRGQELGRLGYHLVDEVHIVPVNYVVDGQRLIFRTTPGSKLLGLVMHSDVAFEIDGMHGEGAAWSVLARGRARILEGEEKREAEALPLRPWTGGAKFTIVAIDVESVSGRRMELTNREAQDG